MGMPQNKNKYGELGKACVFSDPFESVHDTRLIWGMRRQKRRKAPARVVMVELRDFELFSERSGVTVTIHARELREHFDELARVNGHTPEQLLANDSIPAGRPLRCCIIRRIPKVCGSLGGEYINLKMRESRVAVGHSFCGTSAPDSNYSPPARQRGSGQLRSYPQESHSSCDDTSTPRIGKRQTRPPKHLDIFSMSPGSPGGDDAGHSSWTPGTLHRLSSLAASGDPGAVAKLWIRHICGEARCGVISHFRPGSRSDNEEDEKYHLAHPGCSREAFAPLQ